SSDLRATSARWIADDRFEWLSPTGFYKDFDIDVAFPPLSYCTLTVEGLVETAPAADPGGDPAPDGRPSTLQLLQPYTVTEAILTASSVAEDDAPAWAAGMGYTVGARVLRQHRVYEALAANTGADPLALGGQWLDTGPSKRWAPFDQALGTVAQADGLMTMRLEAARIEGVALLDVTGATVRVQAAGYDRTQAVTGGAVTFLDLAGKSWVMVTIAGAGSVSVGTLLIGRVVALGTTEASPTAGITDFSRKTVDDFGEVTIVKRGYAKRMTAKALIRTDALDIVANRIATVRAMPSLWIGQDGLDCLTVYGFFRDFSIEVGPGVSKLSLSIEGLSAANKPAAIVDWEDVGDPKGNKPTDGADVTGHHTAADTKAVAGRPATDVTTAIDANRVAVDKAQADLKAARTSLTSDLAAAQTEAARNTGAVQALLTSDLNAVRTALSSDISAAQTEAARNTGAVQALLTSDLNAVRTALSSDISAAQTETAKVRTDLTGAVASAQRATSTVATDLSAEVARARTEEGALLTKVVTAQGRADGAYSAVTEETATRAAADSALAGRTSSLEATYGGAASGNLAGRSTFKDGSVSGWPGWSGATFGTDAGMPASPGYPAFARFYQRDNLGQVLRRDWGGRRIRIRALMTAVETSKPIGAGFFTIDGNGSITNYVYTTMPGGQGWTWIDYEFLCPAGTAAIQPWLWISAFDNLGAGIVSYYELTDVTDQRYADAKVADEAAARSGADSALSSRTSTVEAQLRGDQDSTIAARIRDEAAARAGADSALAGRTSTVEARAGDLEAKTGIIQTAVTDTTKKLESARLEFSAVTSGGRAALVLRSDKNSGAGVDLIGDLRVSGDVVVDGTFKPTKFDKSSMSKEAQSSWSGSITPSVGQSQTVPWSLGLGTVSPLGRFIWEFAAAVTTNAGQQTTTTYNSKPLYTTYRDDGGLVVRTTDTQGNQYNPRSQGTSMIAASTAFDANFTAFINRGNYDTGIVDEGDYYSRTLSATYTVTSIRLKATWVAI
ncbi:MAG: coiled-coil domain-containing protein, partial [Sphingomonas parapaucimobilis]